jgi:hypothetical protein
VDSPKATVARVTLMPYQRSKPGRRGRMKTFSPSGRLAGKLEAKNDINARAS